MPASSTRTKPIVAKPELKVTTYDRASSGLLAVLVGLLFLVAALTGIWMMNRPAEIDQLVPIELIELPGGVADGAIDETLLVESPEDPDPDAAPEPDAEPQQIEEVFDTITELADVSAEQWLQQYENENQSSGNPGSREGTGRRALGGEGGDSGLPPEQRWYIQFSNQQNLEEYARQLDFFGIELGAIFNDGRLAYLSQLSQPVPQVRETQTGANEQRLYMSWQGGSLKKADEALFRKAGLDVSRATLLQFYPQPTERLLATLEQQYQNRKVTEIRRTYFSVKQTPGGYRFEVTRQSYLR